MELNNIRDKKLVLEEKIRNLMKEFCEETNVSISEIGGHCWINANNTISSGLKIRLEEI